MAACHFSLQTIFFQSIRIGFRNLEFSPRGTGQGILDDSQMKHLVLKDRKGTFSETEIKIPMNGTFTY